MNIIIYLLAAIGSCTVIFVTILCIREMLHASSSRTYRGLQAQVTEAKNHLIEILEHENADPLGKWAVEELERVARTRIYTSSNKLRERLMNFKSNVKDQAPAERRLPASACSPLAEPKLSKQNKMKPTIEDFRKALAADPENPFLQDQLEKMELAENVESTTLNMDFSPFEYWDNDMYGLCAQDGKITNEPSYEKRHTEWRIVKYGGGLWEVEVADEPEAYEVVYRGKIPSNRFLHELLSNLETAPPLDGENSGISSISPPAIPAAGAPDSSAGS